jgi:hypothetical protein
MSTPSPTPSTATELRQLLGGLNWGWRHVCDTVAIFAALGLMALDPSRYRRISDLM